MYIKIRKRTIPFSILAILLIGSLTLATPSYARDLTLVPTHLKIGDKLVPIDQFKKSEPDLNCNQVHYHAANGSFVTALDKTQIPDPAPNGCGYGSVSAVLTVTVVKDLTLNPGDKLEITNGTTLTVTGTLNLHKDSVLNIVNGTLNIDNGTLANGGTINLRVSGTDSFGTVNINGGTVNNDGGTINIDVGTAFNNNKDGTVNNNKGAYGTGTINIAGIFSNEDGKGLNNYGEINIRAGGSLSNDGDAKKLDGGTINIHGGTINNEGILDNRDGGDIRINGGTLNNSHWIQNRQGAVDVNLGGELNNGPRATFNNGDGGNLNNNNGGTVNNDGKIRNSNKGIIDNSGGGTLNNDGKIDNRNGGKIKTNGNLNINADAEVNNLAEGSIQNYGSLTVAEFGTVNNVGVIDNFEAINNFGTINNICGGTINDDGTISGNPIIDIACFTGGGQREDVDKFLTYDEPVQGTTYLPSGTTEYTIGIRYGESIDPSTFKVMLNAIDISGHFNPSFGSSESVSVSIEEARNTLLLEIDGTRSDGRTATDTDRLVIVVGKVKGEIIPSEAGTIRFQVEVEDEPFDIGIIGEGITSLTFTQEDKQITLQNDGTEGAIELEIPKELLDGEFTVMIDEEQIEYDISETETHSVLLIDKPADSSMITIHGTTVIPEFPVVMLLLAGIVALASMITRMKNKINFSLAST